MRINLHTDLALRVLLHLASRSGERASTASIASAQRVSLHHLQKVVRSLKDHGYVTLVRGPRGGVELARDPAEISVGAVVRALEDASALVECFRPDDCGCVLAPACALKSALAEAQEAFYATLDRVTIGAMCSGARGGELKRLIDSLASRE